MMELSYSKRQVPAISSRVLTKQCPLDLTQTLSALLVQPTWNLARAQGMPGASSSKVCRKSSCSGHSSSCHSAPIASCVAAAAAGLLGLSPVVSPAEGGCLGGR